jgi:hypothetical protein
VTLVFDQPQTAGLSGFRAMWDTPVVLAADGAVAEVDRGDFGKAPSALWDPANKLRENGAKPGGLAFDAVHRSLLVRFPGAGQAIYAKLAEGRTIRKVELVLPFRANELWPENYADPSGMSFLGTAWKDTPAQWHAVAWALRRPWQADPTSGPTFNAYLNGAGYWAKYGAQDTAKDRFPQQFGPEEVSDKHPEGRLDITAVLNDPAFGKAVTDRLRGLEDNGLLVRKEEYYDARYLYGGYEWGTATGGRGILIGTPQLVVTFGPPGNAKPPAKLPAAPDFTKLAQSLAGGKGGAPTAVMPSAEKIQALAARYGFNRPAWMPDWQWKRVQELHALGGEEAKFPDTPEAYARWVDDMLSKQPRRWEGFNAAELVQNYMLYSEAWPAPVRDFWKLYWTAWLMPEKDITELVQPWTEAQKARDYYARTGDWRGDTNFYRPYCYNMGTMNFNHTAVAGTLLGGYIIGSDRVMADGRHGLEAWPLRTWSWFDGSTQESIDHYYFAITLKDQKIYADFGPTEMDRMMGRSMLAKSIEELSSCFHPGLRRFISTSGRTGPAELFCIQDGLQYIMDTLSPQGALHDVGNPDTNGIPVVGNDAPPATIARQTLNGPWAPDWVGNMIDNKPLPYEITVDYKMWGGFAATPLWKVSYLGKNYGLASVDVAVGNFAMPIMAQWRREAKPVEKMDEVGTLTCRYGLNKTNLLDSVHRYQRPDGSWSQNPNGSLDTFGGFPCALQYKNKLIILTSPEAKLDDPVYRRPERVTSFQTTIGLFNFQKTPTWKLYVDGQEVTQYPVMVKAGQRITIQDGVSYLGFIPLPSTDCGRDAEVVITNTDTETDLQGGGHAKAALLLNQYNFRSDQPLDVAAADWEKINLAYGGFVVELGDDTEYKDFAAFQQHLKEAKLDTRWEAGTHTLHVAYQSGADTMRCGFKTDYTGDWNHNTPTDQCFSYREVNGQWPYLPQGLDRDSTLTQIGTTGKLEKNGATLTCEPGHMAYLQTEPISGTYAGYNPFSDPTAWALTTPEGVTVQANGKLGMAQVFVRPKENKVWISYGLLPNQTGPEMATALVVTGLKAAPEVELNGKPLTGKLAATTVEGKAAYVIPLVGAGKQ